MEYVTTGFTGVSPRDGILSILPYEYESFAKPYIFEVLGEARPATYVLKCSPRKGWEV